MDIMVGELFTSLNLGTRYFSSFTKVNFNQLSLQRGTYYYLNQKASAKQSVLISQAKQQTRNPINKQLTNRLELSFLNVLALPKASKIGLVFSISYSIPLPPPRAAKYCIAIFAVSVFPAPLSPLDNKR